ncbi:MAG: oxidoreductase [Phaeodactylibacter sp.]|nr:oxidoreductase [Phaeodactylibacter sp.]MCB9052659.1 oxidoreductase [Lewinellaceae bacterium]
MRFIYTLGSLFFFLFLFSCSSQSETTAGIGLPDTLRIQSLDTFPIPSSIRALEVLNDSTAWFAGSGGVYGYTEDGGRHWTVDSLLADSVRPHFRSIAVTEEAVFLLSIASPALLYRSEDKGESWQAVYREDHPAVFYDALAFWDDKAGIAMGDPIDGCLSVLLTRDGGRSWRKLPCSQLPPAEEGEAAFAASNSNIALYGHHAWMVSGGKRARVFHTPDRGASWEVFSTPFIEGEQMTGIFSVDFYDEKQGVIFGGDWNRKEMNSRNKAVTKDGGHTWRLVSEGKGPGYRSCVQYIPQSQGKGIMACGIPGISCSVDGGENWSALSTENFYTLRFGESWQTLWLAGDGKIGKMTLE